MSKQKPFKVIISLANMELDSGLKDDLKCMINVEDESKMSDVPFREVFCFDLSEDCAFLEVTFMKNSHVIAATNILVPESIKSSTEVEQTEKLRMDVRNTISELPYLYATFNLTYINTDLFEECSKSQKLNTDSDENLNPLNVNSISSKDETNQYKSTEILEAFAREDSTNQDLLIDNHKFLIDKQKANSQSAQNISKNDLENPIDNNFVNDPNSQKELIPSTNRSKSTAKRSSNTKGEKNNNPNKWSNKLNIPRFTKGDQKRDDENNEECRDLQELEKREKEREQREKDKERLKQLKTERENREKDRKKKIVKKAPENLTFRENRIENEIKSNNTTARERTSRTPDINNQLSKKTTNYNSNSTNKQTNVTGRSDNKMTPTRGKSKNVVNRHQFGGGSFQKSSSPSDRNRTAASNEDNIKSLKSQTRKRGYMADTINSNNKQVQGRKESSEPIGPKQNYPTSSPLDKNIRRQTIQDGVLNKHVKESDQLKSDGTEDSSQKLDFDKHCLNLQKFDYIDSKNTSENENKNNAINGSPISDEINYLENDPDLEKKFTKNAEAAYFNEVRNSLNMGFDEYNISEQSLKQEPKSTKAPLNKFASQPFNSKYVREDSLTGSEPFTARFANDARAKIEYLKTIIYKLDSQLEVKDTMFNELLGLRDEVFKSNNAREELRKSLLENTKNLREETHKFNTVIFELESHNKDVLSSLKDSHNLIDTLQNEIHLVEVRRQALESENSEIKLKLKSSQIFKNQLDQSRLDYEQSEKRGIDALHSLSAKVSELQEDGEKLYNQKSTLTSKIKELENKVLTLQADSSSESNKNLTLKNENENLSRKLKQYQTSLDILKIVERQKECVIQDLDRSKSQENILYKEIEKLQKELKTNNKFRDDLEEKFYQEMAKMKEVYESSMMECNQMRQEKNLTMKETIDLKNHIGSLEQLLCVKEDVYSQLQMTLERSESLRIETDRLRARLEKSDTLTESQQEKILELETSVTQLKSIVSDKDMQNCNLMDMVIDLKKKDKVYFPFEDDELDYSLADYINDHTESVKLARMFVRDDTSMYHFGNKKIFLKNENNKLFIRVGGGFDNIDDWIRKNLNTELEKVAIKESQYQSNKHSGSKNKISESYKSEKF